jgi:molecular chaperone GrpE
MNDDKQKKVASDAIKDEDSEETTSNVVESEAEETVSQEEFDALKELTGQLEDKYKRALADYQNLQKRTQEEKIGWIRTANGNLIERLLPALDHLQTALKGAKESDQKSSWLQGVEMTVLELQRVLEEEGLQKVPTETFDPTIHEVVEAREGKDGVIEDVFQMGYTLNGKLLRPAKVAVGKGK